MKIISLFIYVLMSLPVIAKDFGQVASSFEIFEEGFVAMIKRKLSNIDLTLEQKKMQDIAKERTNNPVAVIDIKRAKKAREFYFDPSIIVEEDIVLPCGKILHKAGTKVNPLDYMNLDRRIIFIDGRDAEQVEWLRQELVKLKKYDEQRTKEALAPAILKAPIINRIILIGGKIIELQKKIGHELFFDQSGELTAKFGIKAVPAKLEQKGKQIFLKEIALSD